MKDIWTGFIKFPNGWIEEIDVLASCHKEAWQLVQEELDQPGAWDPGGVIIHVEPASGAYISMHK